MTRFLTQYRCELCERTYEKNGILGIDPRTRTGQLGVRLTRDDLSFQRHICHGCASMIPAELVRLRLATVEQLVSDCEVLAEAEHETTVASVEESLDNDKRTLTEKTRDKVSILAFECPSCRFSSGKIESERKMCPNCGHKIGCENV